MLVFESIIFWIGFALFSIAALMFIKLKKRNEFKARINLLVSCITIISYSVMALDTWSISIAGEVIYPTRWLFYAVSCSLLMIEVSQLVRVKKNTLELVMMNSVVMITGFLASITSDLSRIIYFGLSASTYIYLLILINQGRKHWSRNYVMITWTLFPIIWLLSPSGMMLINTFWTAISYLVLDFVTKILFGYLTIKT